MAEYRDITGQNGCESRNLRRKIAKEWLRENAAISILSAD